MTDESQISTWEYLKLIWARSVKELRELRLSVHLLFTRRFQDFSAEAQERQLKYGPHQFFDNLQVDLLPGNRARRHNGRFLKRFTSLRSGIKFAVQN